MRLPTFPTTWHAYYALRSLQLIARRFNHSFLRTLFTQQRGPLVGSGRLFAPGANQIQLAVPA